MVGGRDFRKGSLVPTFAILKKRTERWYVFGTELRGKESLLEAMTVRGPTRIPKWGWNAWSNEKKTKKHPPPSDGETLVRTREEQPTDRWY